MTTVLITGADGPLGHSLTHAFETAGYQTWCSDVYTHDLTIGSDIVELSREAVLNLGRVDIVINNAKVGDWRHIDVLGRLATKCIVNVGSIYGALGPDPSMYQETEITIPSAAYAAEKGALIALTKHQATTLAPVRSNAVVLGGIFRGHSDRFRERYCAKVPLKRMATEADAVNAIMFLASDAASYITGATLYVDGGLSACV